MRFIAYRNLVGVSHTEAEAKAEAAEVMVSISLVSTIQCFSRLLNFSRSKYASKTPQFISGDRWP